MKMEIMDTDVLMDAFDEIKDTLTKNGYSSFGVTILKDQMRTALESLETAKTFIPHHCTLCAKGADCPIWADAKKRNITFTCGDQWVWNGKGCE